MVYHLGRLRQAVKDDGPIWEIEFSIQCRVYIRLLESSG